MKVSNWKNALGFGICLLYLVWSQTVTAAVERAKFQAGNNYLLVEFLDNDLVHFELSASGPGPDVTSPLFVTPQVAKTDYAGPGSFNRSGNTLSTSDMKVVVDGNTLCAGVTDLKKNLLLTTICPLNPAQAWKGLTFTPGVMQHVYGLGEQFIDRGNSNGDWTGRVRTPGDDYGNQMVGFDGGSNGNAQFPILYALGPDYANYALFLDHIYKQRWDITGNPWKVETWGNQIRWYVMTGPDLPDLRKDYLELTGRPPVPPKKAFGLWISEYGYDSWQEIDDKLGQLRADNFPIDGFVLDLQWFGGVPASGNPSSRMGTLTWDTSKFPNPALKLADYKNKGIGIITIEESYIDKGLPEHADLAGREFLVKQCRNGSNGSCDAAQACPAATCPPAFLEHNPWWGKGGMIDWTENTAGDYWHDTKRQALIDAGVIGHWIDLGEPEMYSDQVGRPDWAFGVLPGKHAHADYHNLYSFKWAESIARGYTRHGVERRPFIMARSGASGIQRFGASMWSGDIGGNLANLATHLNAQMHMSLSGMDYFGADIGGFYRSFDNQSNEQRETYTQWFANGMMFDVPGRPHTRNVDCPYPPANPNDGRCRETAPDRIGDKASNLANLRQRYEWSPYLYSLAHRAYLSGEPVVPPLVYYYQNDSNVREMGDEKLLGRDILVATVAGLGATQRDVYLPAGDWIDYHTRQWFHSQGQSFPARPLYPDGVFRLPTYVRAGAILPRMYVDEKTLNIFGKRADNTTRNELIVRVYASSRPSSFTLYEDDGETVAYRNGEVRTTLISQQLSGDGKTETVTLAAASGSYAGAPNSRANVVELVVDNAQGAAVALNGNPLPQQTDRATFDAADSGWFNAGPNLVLAKSGNLDVAADKTFVFTLKAPDVPTVKFLCQHGETTPGQSVYVVGSIPLLGNWNPAQAVKLNPDGPYPTWTAVFSNLPPKTSIEWKCIKRPENAPSPVDWEPGANNVLVTPAAGDAGTTVGDFTQDTVLMQFTCDHGLTVLGQSVYAVGNIPALGAWDPEKAVKLEPTQYPRWVGTIQLPANTPIEWKCIKRPETAPSPVVWEPGANTAFTSPAAGTAMTGGDFQ